MARLNLLADGSAQHGEDGGDTQRGGGHGVEEVAADALHQKIVDDLQELGAALRGRRRRGRRGGRAVRPKQGAQPAVLDYLERVCSHAHLAP